MRKIIPVVLLLLCTCAPTSSRKAVSNNNVSSANQSPEFSRSSNNTPDPSSLLDNAKGNSPTAVEIANLLKQKGIPFIHEILDSTDMMKEIGHPDANAKAGTLSSATTWTQSADYDVTVFDSEQHRREARKRVEKLPGPVYFAECGTIQIMLQPDKMQPNKEAERQAERCTLILKAAYGCK